MISWILLSLVSLHTSGLSAANLPERGNETAVTNSELCTTTGDKGDTKACLDGINALYRGIDGAPDYGAARSLAATACKNKIAEGCNFLGAMQEDGKGGSEDFAAADNSFELACLYGSGGGCFNRAQLIVNEKSPVKDKIVARASYMKSCDKNVAAACNNYGAMALHGEGGEKDPIAARALFDTACGAGNIDGCANFADMLINAPIGERDAQHGLNLLTTACEQLHVRACSLKGTIYHYGRLGRDEFSRDYQVARAAYETACRGGQSEACFQLATFFYDGKGGSENLTEARSLFGSLCRQDFASACFFYGLMLKEGDGGKVDDQGSDEAITKGCVLGDPTACAAIESTKIW